MPTTDLDFTNLEQLRTLLLAAGVRSVSTDPAEVNLPGVLIQVTGVDLDNLAGCTITTTLLCLVPDLKPAQVLEQLQLLFNKVAPVAQSLGGPDATSTIGRWVLPGSTTPLPGIAIPLNLLTTTEE